MKTLTYKCTLLSDVILHSRPASEGNNDTLDFIPGACFLGIAASSLYKSVSNEEALYLFHNGSVRFGDAHPSVGGLRSLKIPACLSTPKLGGADAAYYVHHSVDHGKEEIRNLQLKQCRSGFYVFDTDRKVAEKVESSTAFAVKSAFDKEKRRSKDEQMFCYASLAKGSEFVFEVEVDREDLAGEVDESLKGVRHIGRSRTAQYGLVRIDPIPSAAPVPSVQNNEYAIVYADGRLVFHDEYGQPSFMPSAVQLGFQNAEVDWALSQVRTFQYAPFNGKRACFDSDRCGIEKGSVFVLKTKEIIAGAAYVGDCRNEGFGKVIYNPEFLNADRSGKSVITFCNSDRTRSDVEPVSGGSTLFCYLAGKKKELEQYLRIFSEVNEWKEKNGKAFSGQDFASQWGSVRDIATVGKDAGEIEASICYYLSHGVAKDKWAKKNRKERLKDFMALFINSKDGCTPEMLRSALINLASEMAKDKKED